MLVHLLFTSSALSAWASTADLREAEAWIRSRRKQIPFSVDPGITAVLVSGPDVGLFGDGVLREKGIAADADTLMEVGSLSKTMVGLALATLVTRGEMTWNDPVRKWLGKGFSLGPFDYVSRSLTIKDLMAHRTGLAEGQGEFPFSYMAVEEVISRLKYVEPMNSLRDVMEYSNTAWSVAGEVLRAASNSSSWCEGLHKLLLRPLNLMRTFCHRNEVPEEIAANHLAAVHKSDPCNGPVGTVSTFEFVSTGPPTDISWGVADAAGSVISSVSDMSKILRILLGVITTEILGPRVLQEMLTGQMAVPSSWAEECGWTGWGKDDHTAGHAASTGLGFDVVGDVLLNGKRFAYAEKNGDTNMHKARLGLLPELQKGVMLLSNLGGEMGGTLTAMKFGAMVKLVGGTDAEADEATDASFNSTGFWKKQWGPMTTCSACGAAVSSRVCSPSGYNDLPLPVASFAGTYGSEQYGSQAIALKASGNELQLSMGPIHGLPLSFSNTSFVLQKPCASAVAALVNISVPWALPAVSRLASLSGDDCTLVEWVVPPEVPIAGVSKRNGTVAFPYGCGIIPLPDGPSLYTVSFEGKGVLVSFLGEALPRTEDEQAVIL